MILFVLLFEFRCVFILCMSRVLIKFLDLLFSVVLFFGYFILSLMIFVKIVNGVDVLNGGIFMSILYVIIFNVY